MIFQPNLIVNVVEPTERAHCSNLYPYVTHYIGANRFPLTTSTNSSVFQALFSGEQPFSGPVKQLTFLQMGSYEAPNMIPYASTCKMIDFNGNIASARTAFEVINQLQKVTKVAFLLGQSLQRIDSDKFVYGSSKTPVCPSVRQLKIVVDLDQFYSFYHDCSISLCDGNCLGMMQYSIISLAESILKYAAHSFPNLKNLCVELPEDESLCQAVQGLIEGCPGLRRKTQTTVENILREEQMGYKKRSMDYNRSFRPTSPWTETFTNSLIGDIKSSSVPPTQFVATLPAANFRYELSPTFQGTQSPEEEQFDHYLHPLQSHRPPPGFEPLPFNQKHDSGLGVHEMQNQDVHQRVNSWLSSLEK